MRHFASTMALSQRPPARFFAAFFRWNEYGRSPRLHPFLCHRNRDNVMFRASDYARKYHATHDLYLQSQSEAQLQTKNVRSARELDRNEYEIDTEGTDVKSHVTPEKGEVAPHQIQVDKQEQLITLEELESEESELKHSVRSLLRKVPNSVVIITVTSIDPDTKQHVPMGIAVSSLSSVTLDPPTISFNIKQSSKTLDAIRAANGLFRVHFLKADEGGAKAAELFCRGNHTAAYTSRSKRLRLFIPSSEQEEGATASLAPQIWTNSVQATMECTITHEFPVADHVILAARVNAVEQKTSGSPLMIYVDGKYMRSNFTIALHDKSEKSAQNESSFPVWDFPLFPGDQERRKYMEFIKRMVKESPEHLDNPEGARKLELSLPYHPSCLGIDLGLLFNECRRETGRKVENPVEKRDFPVLCDFYGRLTPSTRASIMNRAIRLVKDDSRYLELKYGTFLHYLGVSNNSQDLLPSDIMSSLRAAGLVSDFKPKTLNEGQRDKSTYHIERMERVEIQVRDYLRTLDFRTASKISFETIIKMLGEDKYAAIGFKNCRGRLVSDSHPQKFGGSSIDITGNISQAEIRVAMSRLMLYLQIDRHDMFRKRFNVPKVEILRCIGLHPTITGMDIEYLFGKIHYLFYRTSDFHDFSEAIDKMLEPWFEKKIEWDEFGKRVTEFVETTPMRAVSWVKTDQLAAMGLHWNATVTIPTRGWNTQQKLVQSPILDTIVAKELKAYYGKGTEEENRVIASFLKKKHDFDIRTTSIDNTPYDRMSQPPIDATEKSVELKQDANEFNERAPTFSGSKFTPALRIRFQKNRDTNIVRRSSF